MSAANAAVLGTRQLLGVRERIRKPLRYLRAKILGEKIAKVYCAGTARDSSPQHR